MPSSSPPSPPSRSPGPHRPTPVRPGLALLVGGLVTLYGGFATLALVPHRVTLALVGDAALVAGFALFLYGRYGR